VRIGSTKQNCVMATSSYAALSLLLLSEQQQPADEQHPRPAEQQVLLAINESRVLRSTKVAVAGPSSS
jgi:hypothetical protein